LLSVELGYLLRRGELDLYATNKPILFEMSDTVPGSRVLRGAVRAAAK
jgi:polar amino acid transport system substrate-binding protein